MYVQVRSCFHLDIEIIVWSTKPDTFNKSKHTVHTKVFIKWNSLNFYGILCNFILLLIGCKNKTQINSIDCCTHWMESVNKIIVKGNCTCVRRVVCCNFPCFPYSVFLCYILTINYNGNYYILEKYTHLTSKHCESAL